MNKLLISFFEQFFYENYKIHHQHLKQDIQNF